MSINYKQSGVNIDAGNQAVERITEAAASTFSTHVLTGLGNFGAFFDLAGVMQEYRHPVLVQSIDGVGTKVIAARMANDFSRIGKDLLSACCNDIAVHGAKPLTFLDYIANDTLDPERVGAIIDGLAEGCREHGISLIGGETAEMPDTYLPGEHDLVGIVTGAAEKGRIINGDTIVPGDLIIGVSSSGLHTNGYSLARKILFDHAGLNIRDPLPGSSGSLGSLDNSGRNGEKSGGAGAVGRKERQISIAEALLSPHLNYTSMIQGLMNSNSGGGIDIHGMAHITGGGIPENVPRILPQGCTACIDADSWEIPHIFRVLQQLGEVAVPEMYRTFNMGIGLAIILPARDASEAEKIIQEEYGMSARIIGTVTETPAEALSEASAEAISEAPEGKPGKTVLRKEKKQGKGEIIIQNRDGIICSSGENAHI